MSIAVAIGISMAGTAPFIIQPVYLGALADHLQFSSEQLGFVAGSEISGSVIASIAAFFWVKRWNWRVVAAFALAFTFLGNLASAWVTDFHLMAATRFLTGVLGLGTAYALAVAAVSDTQKLNRNFSLAIVGQVSVGVLAFALLPPHIEAWGLKAVFVPLALLGLVMLPALRHLPRSRMERSAVEHSAAAGSTVPAWLALGCQWVWYVGIGGLWAFIERLGVDAGIEHAAVGRGLAVGMAVSLAGAFGAAAIGDRFGRILPLTVALLGQAASIWMIAGVGVPNDFLVAVTLFNICWNLALPFILGTAAIADTSGRLIVLLPMAQTTALVVGPVTAGILIGEFGLWAVLYQAAAAIFVAILIYYVVVNMITARERDEALSRRNPCHR
ncbi:MAG: MFS transporter [Woeseiaceae bacterium]